MNNNNYPNNIIVIPLESKVLLPSVVLRLMIRGKQANDLTKTYFRQVSASTTNKNLINDIWVACIPVKPNFVKKKSSKVNLLLNSSSNKRDDEVVSQAPQVPVPPPAATAAYNKNNNNTNDVLVSNVDRYRLLEYGCLARIVRVQRSGVNLFGVFVEGLTRFKVSNFYQNTPSMTPYPGCWMAQVDYINDDTRIMKELSLDEKEKIATFKELSQVFVIKMRELQLPETLLQQLSKVVNTTPVSSLADLLVALIETTFEERFKMLSTPLLKDRLQMASEWMTRQLHVLQISDTLGSGIEGKMSKRQREFYLRQQVCGGEN